MQKMGHFLKERRSTFHFCTQWVAAFSKNAPEAKNPGRKKKWGGEGTPHGNSGSNERNLTWKEQKGICWTVTHLGEVQEGGDSCLDTKKVGIERGSKRMVYGGSIEKRGGYCVKFLIPGG